MSLLAPSLAGANYMTSNNDDKESSTNGAAEFTRRKKWPEILLKELVGGTIFCLKPVLVRRASQQQPGGTSTWGWKIVYSSPAASEMLGQKPAELDGKDFFDLVFAPDHPQLHTFLNSLLTPSLPHHSSSATVATTSSSNFGGPTHAQNKDFSPSQTTYVRMLTSSGDSPVSMSDTPTSSSRRSGPVVWELRAHASGVGEEGGGMNNAGLEGFGGASAGMGTVVPGGAGEEGGMRGKAVWIMGRRVGEPSGDSEGSGNGSNNGNGNGNGQSLDAFLELKLENERLREELRELQLDLDEEFVPPRKGSYHDLSPTKPHGSYGYNPSSSPSSSASSSPSSTSSSQSRALPSMPTNASSSSSSTKPKLKTAGRPPKDSSSASKLEKEREREKKRAKKMSLAAQGGEKEGMHVCVTCGRTDSPEWRKGPLGPKTLCNACGLRWAKRNSSQPGRKERKPTDGKK